MIACFIVTGGFVAFDTALRKPKNLDISSHAETETSKGFGKLLRKRSELLSAFDQDLP